MSAKGTRSSSRPMTRTPRLISGLLLALLVLGAGLTLSGCKSNAEPENQAERPWNRPYNWEHGLPSGMWERR
jgi:hypothetical protein